MTVREPRASPTRFDHAGRSKRGNMPPTTAPDPHNRPRYRPLAVRPRHVVPAECLQPSDGWLVAEGAVWSLEIVEVELAREGSGSLRAAV